MTKERIMKKKYLCSKCKELALEVYDSVNPNNGSQEVVITDSLGLETIYVTLKNKEEAKIVESMSPEILNEYLIKKTREKEAYSPYGLNLYCKDCKKIYCQKHYRGAIFESETRYKCPNGHEKTLRD